MDIWSKQFTPSQKKEKRFQQILEEIPLPDKLKGRKLVYSVVFLEPGAEAGNHYHSSAEEVFVGFGKIKAYFEERTTKEKKILDMNPLTNNDLLTAVSPGIGIAHKIVNYGEDPAIIIEICTKDLETKEIHDYEISL